MGLAGIPWWTTDIGGFHGGDPKDPDFRELLVRWFEYGTFCPVMRLHGDREPRQPQVGTTGGATCRSGAENDFLCHAIEALDHGHGPVRLQFLKIRSQRGAHDAATN